MFKAVEDRKRSGYVDCQHFETMITTVDEVNSHKTKVPEEFIFRSVLLDRFTAA